MVSRFESMRRLKSPLDSNLIAYRISFLNGEIVKRFYNLEHLKKPEMVMD